jgi:PAS domain S-box-containing protein
VIGRDGVADGGPADIAAAGDALLVASRDGTILFVSDAFSRLIGRPAEEMVGRSATAAGLASESHQRWVLDRLPTSGQGVRYTREIDTAQGRRPVEIELHRMSILEQELVVAAYRAVESGVSAAVDASILGVVVDQAPVGVVVYDRELRILRVNRMIEHMGRITPRHLGMRLTDAVPEVSPKVIHTIQQVFSTGESVTNMETSGPDDRRYLLNLFPIRNSTGEVGLVGCIVSDITDRASAERLTRELAAIVESSDDAILSEDLDGTIRSWNAGAERLYGIAAADAVGKSITIIVPEDRHGEPEDILRRIAAGESVERLETTRRRADGSIVDVSLTVSPVYDDQGGITAASVIARDVTERRVAEARRGAILEVALDAIVTMDARGRIVEFNPAAERMFGYTSGQAVGRTVAEMLVPPDQRDAHRRGLAEYRRTGVGPLIGQRTETTAMRADGSLFPAEVAINALPLERDLLFTAHVRDISRRREAERALLQSEQHRREILASMLQAEEDERSRIATELHDDTVQVMTAALLAMDRVTMSARKIGNANLEAAVVLVRGTLEEATERARRLMFELRPAILHERGLQAALRVLTDQTAHESRATATMRCDVGRYDHSTEELVYRTVQEALSNIRKHANPTTLRVTIREQGGILTGEIEDDGRGFDIDGVKSRPRAALHLGLDSLTERISAAGGEARVASTPGKGTQVWFRLPVSGHRMPRTSSR